MRQWRRGNGTARSIHSLPPRFLWRRCVGRHGGAFAPRVGAQRGLERRGAVVNRGDGHGVARELGRKRKGSRQSGEGEQRLVGTSWSCSPRRETERRGPGWRAQRRWSGGSSASLRVATGRGDGGFAIWPLAEFLLSRTGPPGVTKRSFSF